MIKKTFIVLSLICLTFSSSVFAGGDVSSTSDDGLYNPVPTIMHHIADAHEWHLWGEGDNSFSIPLPVILYTEYGLDIFMSSEFNHGHSKVVKDNRVYSIDSHSHIIEEGGASIIDLSITKNVASMLISVFLLFFVMARVSGMYKKPNSAPTGLQSFICLLYTSPSPRD